MADYPDESTTVVQRVFEAPIERAWRAFTEPASLGRWLWAGYASNVETHVQLEVGGSYGCWTDAPEGEFGWEGDRWGVIGRYLEVSEPARLTYTVRWEAPVGYNQGSDTPPDELVQVSFASENGGTRITMRHGGLPPDGASARAHGQAIESMFDHLGEVLTVT